MGRKIELNDLWFIPLNYMKDYQNQKKKWGRVKLTNPMGGGRAAIEVYGKKYCTVRKSISTVQKPFRHPKKAATKVSRARVSRLALLPKLMTP